MIISFTVENWMSFADRTTFSMIASRELQHKERVPKIHKYNLKLLPVTAIYGGNASGKTNFFAALKFVRDLIIEGTRVEQTIPVKPFLLNPLNIKKPSYFSIVLFLNNTIYDFSFSVVKNNVIEEKLIEVFTKDEKILYHRHNGKCDINVKDDGFLDFAFRGTRDNQLFLNNSVSQKVERFKPVYDWFNNNLELIAPDSRFDPVEEFLDDKNPTFKKLNNLLFQLDTGIARLAGEEIPAETIDLPKYLISKLLEKLKEGEAAKLLGGSLDKSIIVSKMDGKLMVKRLIAFHTDSDGTEQKFDLNMESDGTQRTIDLLPAFLDISIPPSAKVYVIDEVDRSIHPLLIRRLMEFYLNNCTTSSRSQLLFTTHNVLLMDQDLLRRDEMWVAERNKEGVSTLIPFSQYKDIRYDKNILKSYLQGRLGGIPRISLINSDYN